MRLFYCPVHGRVTEQSVEIAISELWRVDNLFGEEPCEHCRQWYYGLAKKKAKRPGES